MFIGQLLFLLRRGLVDVHNLFERGGFKQEWELTGSGLDLAWVVTSDGFFWAGLRFFHFPKTSSYKLFIRTYPSIIHYDGKERSLFEWCGGLMVKLLTSHSEGSKFNPR